MRMSSSVRVSKLLCLILRHRPEEFDVEVDRYGSADVEEVVSALQKQDSDIGLADVESVVYDAQKKRFEIAEGRIRARYGHSFPVDMSTDPTEPPEYLYKGVGPRDVDRVMDAGLRPVDRHFVHLSFDADLAARLGGRRGGRGAVIRVDALRAHKAGVLFYDCGPTVLTAEVPPEFVVLESPAQEPPAHEPPDQPPTRIQETPGAVQEPGPMTFGRSRKFGTRR